MIRIRVDFGGGYYGVRILRDARDELTCVLVEESFQRLVPPALRYYDARAGEWGVEAAALPHLRFWAEFCRRACGVEAESNSPDCLWAEFPPELPEEVTTQELWEHLTRAGVCLTLALGGRRLTVSGPAGSLGPEIRLQLARHRDSLAALVREVWGPPEPEPIESIELRLDEEASADVEVEH